MPPRPGSPCRYALMKNCTLKPLRAAGTAGSGRASASPRRRPGPDGLPLDDPRRPPHEDERALDGRPPRAVTWTRAVIGAVRLVTGFGLKLTEATTRRSPAALRSPTGSEPLGGGCCPPPPTTPVGLEMADEPRSLRGHAHADRAPPVVLDHVLRVGRAGDLAAVLALGAAAQPLERVRDRLVAGPLAAVRLRRLPTAAVPEIDGSAVLTGRAAVTTAVGFDVAVSWPSLFLATTCERIRNPASAWRRV